MRFVIIGLVVALAVVGFLLLPTTPRNTGVTYQLLSGSESPPFSVVREPKELRFPRDHGPHPEFQTEWWYYTGNLVSDEGEQFGYQMTIFRRGLTPGEVRRQSAFATNQVYFGHLAFTDVEGGEHRALERFARGSPESAGASGDPFKVYLDDWRIEGLDAAANSVHLQAREPGIAIDLTLKAAKPIVAHGEGGLSPKSSETGNATYYLSFTDMDTEGTLEIDGRSIHVQGSSWFDHQWGTRALGPEVTGWDWFGLQLDDGRELMLLQFRARAGGIEPVSGGTIVAPNGESRWIPADQFEIRPLTTWTSRETGVSYPSGWEISIPGEGLELVLEPKIEDQEMQLTIEYWEGAVIIRGTVAGEGYVELTGYSGSMEGLF